MKISKIEQQSLEKNIIKFIQKKQISNQNFKSIKFNISKTVKFCQRKEFLIILRDWIKGDFSDYEIIYDFDFFKYLFWDGQYDNKIKKLENGLLIGMVTNQMLESTTIKKVLKTLEYVSKIQIYINFRIEQYYFVGEYKKGKRIGKWEYCYHQYLKKQKIDFFFRGGYYDNNGIKQGKWIEFLDGFTFFLSTLNSKKLKILNIGEYKNGRKIGIWDTSLITSFHNYLLLIIRYCGTYDINGKKNGEWTEIYDFSFGLLLQLFNYSEYIITQTGNYKEGVKYSRWNIIFPDDDFRNFEIYDEEDQEKEDEIFGDVYDEDGMKNGRWVELHDRYLQCPMINVGEYKKGVKVGKWDMIDDEYQGGGGHFDDFGQKVGEWKQLITIQFTTAFQDYIEVEKELVIGLFMVK
ncbi:unnamed protein product [Paramecium octaurelia]|uniref:Uncharacterized protein n=1 Tax=Paramecium octaurelia TaxID=43137 RepID=A0A8S1X0R1_PAROT|nr:unnamed protein product [Paramecium octaurelia]